MMSQYQSAVLDTTVSFIRSVITTYRLLLWLYLVSHNKGLQMSCQIQMVNHTSSPSDSLTQCALYYFASALAYLFFVICFS